MSSTCPTCGKPNVAGGRNVEHRPGWARSYDRGAHTSRDCAAYVARVQADDAAWDAKEAADAAYLAGAEARLAAAGLL